MGRPPCCDKIGVKKGPWTPEEDIILVSYVQQHGAANWRSIPTHTGLLRCSKSCRLRWTNYLRPGIKRGNFTDHEDKMIIHLQALLGNRWAAIASYLQQRTDNDIKNYWNTHLKKKLKKLHDGQNQDGFCSTASIQPKGQWERRLQTDIHLAKQALCEALSLDNKPNTTTTISKTSNSYNHQEQTITPSTPYASSAENIERLLQSWMRNPPKPRSNSSSSDHGVHGATATTTTEGLDSMFSYSSSNSDASQPGDGIGSLTPEEINTLFQDESKPNIEGTAGTPTLEHVIHLSLLEKWLFDENGASDQDPDEDLINMSLEDHSCLF